MRNISIAVLVLFLIVLQAPVFAQSNSEWALGDERGYVAYAEFGGTANSAGQVYQLNSKLGYNFTQHFGMDAGIPYYFVHASSSTNSGISGKGVGNPWVDLRWKFLGPTVNFGSVLTGAAPLGDSKLGLSTGRATFDWTNHFDHSFNKVTPFVEAGLSNTTADSRLFVRPYTTLGMNSHFRGGGEIKVWKSVNVGGAGYGIVPFGNQTVFSRVVKASQIVTPGPSHGRTFDSSQQTTGNAQIAADNGYSAWVDAGLNRYMDAELGYTRSVHYDLNSVSFSLGFNVGHLLHSSE